MRNGKFIFVSNGKCNRLFRRPEGPAFGIKVLLLVSSSRFGVQLASQSGGEDDAEGGRSWVATLRLCGLVTKFKLQRETQRTHKRNSSVVRSLNSMLRLCDEREHGLKLSHLRGRTGEHRTSNCSENAQKKQFCCTKFKFNAASV